MTLPGAGREGEAWIEVHANTDHVEREIEQGVSRAAEGAESDLKKTGNDIGDTLAGGINDDLKTHGREFQQSIERSTKGRIIKSQFGWRDAGTGRFVKKLGDDVEGEIEHAFRSLTRDGGPVSSFGQGVADAIGAAFNTSGKSPLIAVLGVAILAIVGVVLAAIQAISALGAVLITVPALLAAVGLQFAVFKVAFSGIGDAISGAFAAKNWKEFEAALAGLTPSAKLFVKSLMPAKQLFKDLKAIIQENFFASVGESVGRLIRTLDPILRRGFSGLASQLGTLLRQLANFFSSPSFTTFLNRVFPATIAFLDRFGPDFVTFLKGLVDAANAALPFLTDLGNLISNSLAEIGYFLETAANDPEFQKWLEDMEDTLESIQGLFFSILGLIKQFSASLNEAGGKDLIDTISESLNTLTGFLASPVGQKAMQGLVNLSIIGIKSFMGLVLALLLVAAGVEVVLEWLQSLGEFVVGPFADYFEAGLTAIGHFFTWVGETIIAAFDWIVDKITDAAAWIIMKILGIRDAGVNYITTFLNTLKALPGKILAAVAGFASLLIEKGKALIDGLIAGIRSKFGELRNAAKTLAGIIVANLPGSPAEEGPLSGRGYSLYRGQALVEDFAKGIKMEGPTLRDASVDAVSNIVFGPNSVRVGFEGVVPTPQQARVTGSAAGQGILSQLAARNTRLAVRTL